MLKEEYLEKRIPLLEEIKELEKGCIGCNLHEELGREKNNTILSNACKECPLGKVISLYGKELLETTREFRTENNISFRGKKR